MTEKKILYDRFAQIQFYKMKNANTWKKTPTLEKVNKLNFKKTQKKITIQT